MKTGQELLFAVVLTKLPATVICQQFFKGIEINRAWWTEATNQDRAELITAEVRAFVNRNIGKYRQ